MTDKSLRDEVAELTETVRELRDREVADTLRELCAEVEKLRAERAMHHCTGCSCMHVHHWYPQPLITPCAPAMPQIWYGTVTNGGTQVTPSVYTTNAVSVTSSISN